MAVKPMLSYSMESIPTTATKKSIMDIPVTISGFIMGMLVTDVIAALANLLFIL